ncbi:hypothetical protein ACWKW6_32530 [Dyadobacter jiangsuensis]|uniref:hypothetical protein n=1 Tax=Dyadobacter fermentans TaxID=94254 RepID=UPI001CBB7411|nr:hypothetical protein [Dyadobacter fermentans]MBZ1361258.1 hypothetical protein [Dyadobacter fermentans]
MSNSLAYGLAAPLASRSGCKKAEQQAQHGECGYVDPGFQVMKEALLRFNVSDEHNDAGQ